MFSKLTNVVALAAFALPAMAMKQKTPLKPAHFKEGRPGMPGMSGGPLLPFTNTQQSTTNEGYGPEQSGYVQPTINKAGGVDEGDYPLFGDRNQQDLDRERNEALRKEQKRREAFNKAKEPTTPGWMRNITPKERFGLPGFADTITLKNGAPAKNPFWRTAELVLGLSLGLGAFCATEYGFKNLALKNDTITDALGMKGGEHDLHDVMFQNVKNLDGNAVKFEQLHGYVYAYIMTGAFFVFLSLYCILHTSGLKKGYALVLSSLILVAGAISSAGFCAHMHTAIESDMWYHNPSIWVGVGLATVVVAISLIWSMYACFLSRKLAPKPDNMNDAADL